MERIAIIADDLTGASDSGVQFARKGLQTQVIFDSRALSEESALLDAVVIDTDSRSITGKEAYARVTKAAEALQRNGYVSLYKKLDSTLRGNLGWEIDAVMDVYSFEAALIVPAFPRIGRTTVNGIHYLNGVPVNQTEIAKDPKTPVPEAEIAKLLETQSKRRAGSVFLETVRQGRDSLQLSIQTALEKHIALIIIDAETEEDMWLIAETMKLYGNRFLWVGSAGLAEHLPVVERPVNGNPLSADLNDHNPVMLVAGSISKVTREQVEVVNEENGVEAVELDPIALLTSPRQEKRELERCREMLLAALNQKRDVSFHSGSSPEQVSEAKQLGAASGLAPSDVSNRIADALGKVTAEVLSQRELRGLVLTGGDTAKAVCRHLGVHGIKLVKEIEPGIPFGQLLGANSLFVVTKAGAFGNKQSLNHAMKWLKGGSSHE